MNLLAFASLFILITLFFIVRHQGRIARNRTLFKKHFSHFELCDDNESLALFLRHQEQANTKIPLSNIISSEIYLNNKMINIITAQHCFDDEKEQKTYLHFDRVYRQKIMDNHVREIALKIQDNNNKKYHFCLYLRKGNQRFTRYKYQDVVKNLIAWNWLINVGMDSRRKDENKI